jgi:hypothetical protein
MDDSGGGTEGKKKRENHGMESYDTTPRVRHSSFVRSFFYSFLIFLSFIYFFDFLPRVVPTNAIYLSLSPSPSGLAGED